MPYTRKSRTSVWIWIWSSWACLLSSFMIPPPIPFFSLFSIFNLHLLPPSPLYSPYLFLTSYICLWMIQPLFLFLRDLKFLSILFFECVLGVAEGIQRRKHWYNLGFRRSGCVSIQPSLPALSIKDSVQFSRSVVSNSVNPWIAACQAFLSMTNSWSLLKPMSTEWVMPSSHLILHRPLLLLPPIPPSIRAFSNESTLHIRWPKYWSFSFSISPSNEHPGLIFRMDWLDLLAVQGTLRSLLQHHNSKASILQHSAFFTVQISHPYVTTGKTIALTRQTFVGKVMSLLLICYLGWS